MSQHHFHLRAQWDGGLHGVGQIESGNLKTSVSVPTEFRGPGIGTNPEELLLGSAATCYIITLGAKLERNNIAVSQLSLETEGILTKVGGLHFTDIIHRPLIALTKDASEDEIEKANRFCYESEESCMISKAMRGNVAIHVEPTVTSNQ